MPSTTKSRACYDNDTFTHIHPNMLVVFLMASEKKATKKIKSLRFSYGHKFSLTSIWFVFETRKSKERKKKLTKRSDLEKHWTYSKNTHAKSNVEMLLGYKEVKWKLIPENEHRQKNMQVATRVIESSRIFIWFLKGQQSQFEWYAYQNGCICVLNVTNKCKLNGQRTFFYSDTVE